MSLRPRKQIRKSRKKKITSGLLREGVADEKHAYAAYKRLAKRAMTKGERVKFLSMSNDEARHAGYLEEMIERRLEAK